MSANYRDSYVTTGSGDHEGRNGEQKKNMFTSMLESVASGKRLPEKNLLVLGGTPETQREFMESLSSSESKRNSDKNKLPPVANSFALGYTYYDVLDADQDDTLARVSLYLLSQPSDKFSALISPLLDPKAIQNTAVVILLDWSTPHLWMGELARWVSLFKSVTQKLDHAEHGEMEEVMDGWKMRGRGGSSTNLDGTPSAAATGGDGDSTLPLGQGEWSEPLGLPLCVVCQNSQRMEVLEKNQGWTEGDFDTVLQYLRTVLLRHGASLIYTSQNSPSQLPILIHSTLGITSLLKRQPLKHNVIDRDKIVVPPNWDSWGKVRVLGGNFDAEAVSESWALDIDERFSAGGTPTLEDLEENRRRADEEGDDVQTDSAVARYNDWCKEPDTGGLALVQNAMNKGDDVTVKSENTQEFLEAQLRILEVFKSKQPDRTDSSHVGLESLSKHYQDGGLAAVSEHIGPVQINVGGIQVDADDMVQQINDRKPQAPSEASADDAPSPSFEVKDLNNTQLDTFFQGLMKKTKPADSPRS